MKNTPISKLTLLVVAAGLSACVSTQQTTEIRSVSMEKKSHQLVTSIELSQAVGVVGRPFASRMLHTDNYIDEAEYSMSTMPPGLKFDAARGVITGVPTAPGFYPIHLAVRERVASDSFRPSPDQRWWTGDVELAIYNPIIDSE